MKKFCKIALVACFLADIFIVPVLTKLEPPKTVSTFENRTLAEVPVFTAETFWSGEYFADWSNYLSDHLFLRNGWLWAYTFYKVNVADKLVVNNVVLSDDVLLQYNAPGEVVEDYNERAENMAASLEQLKNDAASVGATLIVTGIPEQYSIFADRYPSFMESNAKKLSAVSTAYFGALDEHGVDYINMREVFEATGNVDAYYSKADHHYNLKGAYLTYRTVMDKAASLGVQGDVLTEDEFAFRELPQMFFGSRNRQLYNTTFPEKLFVYDLNEPVEFERIESGVQTASTVFKMPEESDFSVAYDLYMGGDNPETVIKTNRPELPKILVFGDSFTNAAETFFYLSFDEMRSVDLRHYTEKTITEYILDYQPDLVVYMRDDTCYLAEVGNAVFR